MNGEPSANHSPRWKVSCHILVEDPGVVHLADLQIALYIKLRLGVCVVVTERARENIYERKLLWDYQKDLLV